MKVARKNNVLWEVTPEPPFLETDFRQIDKAGRFPGSRFGDPEGRPAGGVNGSIRCGASRAASEQSYGVEPEVYRPSLSGNFHGEIVGEDIGFLVRYSAGLGSRHICAIADGINVLPFSF